MKDKQKYSELLKNMAREWKWLFGYMKRYWAQILLYIFIGVAATVMGLGTSVASKHLIDAVISKEKTALIESAVITVGLAVFSIVFNAVSSWISAKVSTKTNNDIKQEIYNHILLANWEDINRYQAGELLNRIEGDVNTVSNGVITFIPSFVTKFVSFFGALIIVLYYDKTMALLALISAPFLFFSSRFLIKSVRKYNKKMREVNGEVLSYSDESMQNLQVIKAFDLTKTYIRNFFDLTKYYRSVRLSYEKFSIIITLVLSLLGLVVSYLCYGWGVYRLWQGAITYGTMTLFLQIAGTLSSSFSSLAGLVPTAITIATSAGRIKEITTFSKESDADKEQAEAIKNSARESRISLVAEDIHFTYKTSENEVISGIDFSAQAGQTVAFVGASGEGKTTLLKLFLGLISPSSGSLHIDNEKGETVPISDSTRRFCAYVPQEKSIFSGTIAENLRLGKADASDSEIQQVLEQVEMWDFVSSMSNGINTVVGKGGTDLSHGQSQRISIARALLRDPEILLLDEATSALDADTETKVLQNIMHNKEYRICIITTHRDSLLKYCDHIYKITDEGKLEASTHD